MIKLTWDSDGSIESFSVFRAEQSMDSTNLPEPIAKDITEKTYIDNLVEKGKTYFYRVASHKGEQRKLSDEIQIKASNFTEYADTYLELKDSITDTGLKPKTFTSENLIFQDESAVFNGSTSISTDESSDFNFGAGDFTIECTVKTKVGGTLFDLRKLSSGQYGNAIVLDKYNKWLGFTNGSAWFGVDINFNDEQFHHIALTRQSGVMRWFVDGKKVIETQDTTNFTEDRSVCIGKTKSNSSAYTSGEMKKVRITKGLARYTEDFELTYQV